MERHRFGGCGKGRQYGKTILIVISLFAILWIGANPALSTQYPSPPSFADLAEHVNHSVVNISTTQVIQQSPAQNPFWEFFGMPPQRERKAHALGSGFIIDREGLILTNNHVIEKAQEIKVRIESGREYDATVVGRDPKTDLALVRIKPDDQIPAPVSLGDSDKVRVGDWVMAVGNPFGLGHTVTVGIIGAKQRIIGAGPYDDFLQTDAAINPGNSGGPLFDMNGEVIGINTAIVAQGQGIGFAIPVNMAKELLPQLKTGKIVRGWLGVMIQDVTPELAKSFGLSEAKGVLVSGFTQESPARKAGLKRGDVVVQFNGKEVDNAHMLSRMVAATEPGTKVEIGIIRKGKAETVSVTIGQMPQEGGAPETPSAEESAWGITVQNLTPELAQRFGWKENEEGVLVSKVEEGSTAAEAGLRPGDLIKEVNQQPVTSVSEYRKILSEIKSGENLLLLVRRGQNTIYIVVKHPEK